MDVLTLSAVCILCTSQPPNLSAAVAQWQPLIAEASARFAMPESWIARVMTAESGGHTMLNGQPITSTAGAMGLMQLMPKTYADLRHRYGLGPDPYAVRDNILAGTAYLRLLYQRYGYPNLFAAYNAGPGRLDDFLLRGRPLPAQTTAYIASIIPGRMALDRSHNTPLVGASDHVEQALFVPLHTVVSLPAAAPNVPASDAGSAHVPQHSQGDPNARLFVVLTTPSP